MLSEFLATHREEIITKTSAKVASRPAPRGASEELKTGVPRFLEQVVTALRIEEATGRAGSEHEIGLTAAAHGKAPEEIAFKAAQVIHDYGDVCQAITELTVELHSPITSEESRTLNRCLDQAMAGAVSDLGRQGAFAHELRNLLSNSILAFDVLKNGTVGVGGSTGALLGRNLERMRDLIEGSLAEVRRKTGVKKRERVLLSEFIEEIEVSASIEAKARGLQLTVTPAPPGVSVAIDRQILAAAVANLLQNALKFTRPGGHVLLRMLADEARALIAIEDECGGLAGNPEDLFTPFLQRGSDRTGLGLGLAIAREGITANGGTITARNAGAGCAFTIELPRLQLDEVTPATTQLAASGADR